MNSKIVSSLLSTPKKKVRLWKPNRVIIVGCGGIGSHLWDFIAQEIWSRFEINSDKSVRYGQRRTVVNKFVLIDNDAVEIKNLFRQSYFPEHVGMSKAEALASKYHRALQKHKVSVEAKKMWIDDKSKFFEDNDLILLGVDNHATRKMVSDILHPDRDTGHSLQNIMLVSGGNTGTLVTVQTMVIRGGKLSTASLEHMHPDITNPDDKHPRDVACTDRTAAVDDPQLFRANLMAASQMFQIFANTLDQKDMDYCELWMDVANQSYRKVDIPDKEIIQNAG